MNILTDPAPRVVMIKDAEVPIEADFRVSVRFELLMQEPIGEAEKILRALNLYYPTIPANLPSAVDRILWFYRGGREEVTLSGGKCKSTTQIYSFDFDDEYIYAAFLSQYGTDLQDVSFLHWWKFKAMFRSLKDDCEIVKIMGYRAAELTPGMGKEQKEFLRNMKRLYALPLQESEREKLSSIEEALLHGGDVSGVL